MGGRGGASGAGGAGSAVTGAGAGASAGTSKGEKKTNAAKTAGGGGSGGAVQDAAYDKGYQSALTKAKTASDKQKLQDANAAIQKTSGMDINQIISSQQANLTNNYTKSKNSLDFLAGKAKLGSLGNSKSAISKKVAQYMKKNNPALQAETLKAIQNGASAMGARLALMQKVYTNVSKELMKEIGK